MKKISLYAAYFASRQLQAWMLHEISVVSTWFEVATSVHRAAQQFIDWNHYILQYLAELPVKHNQMLSAIRFAMQNVMRNLVSSQWTWAINATLEHRAIAMSPYLPGRSTAIYSDTSAKPQPWKRYRCFDMILDVWRACRWTFRRWGCLHSWICISLLTHGGLFEQRSPGNANDKASYSQGWSVFVPN